MTKAIEADEAISRLFDILKDAAKDDPALRSRMISALGVTVRYEGAEQFEGSDPAKMASEWSQDAFKRIWNGATAAQIKAALKEHALATSTDMRGLRKPQLVELIYERAFEQADSRGLI